MRLILRLNFILCFCAFCSVIVRWGDSTDHMFQWNIYCGVHILLLTARSRESGLIDVKPARTASVPTASATRYEISRTRSRGGNSGPSESLNAGENSLNTRAAAENIGSVTRRAPAAIVEQCSGQHPQETKLAMLIFWKGAAFIQQWIVQ